MTNELTIFSTNFEKQFMVISEFAEPTISTSYNEGCDDDGFTPDGSYGDRRVTTAIGRDLLETQKEHVQEVFDAFVARFHEKTAKLFIITKKNGKEIEQMEVTPDCTITFN